MSGRSEYRKTMVARNPGNADVLALLAECDRLHLQVERMSRDREVLEGNAREAARLYAEVCADNNYLCGQLTAAQQYAERLSQACSVFEKNSKGAMDLYETLLKCEKALQLVVDLSSENLRQYEATGLHQIEADAAAALRVVRIAIGKEAVA